MTLKSLLFLSLSLMIPVAGANELERMESVSEELSQLMYQAMIDEAAAGGADVSRLRASVPATDWDQPMREAAGCILDTYKEKIGSDGVTEMLDKMESILPELRGAGMAAFDTMQGLQPAGISDEEAIAISQSCGMMELMQKQMMNSDFMQEAMKLMSGN